MTIENTMRTIRVNANRVQGRIRGVNAIIRDEHKRDPDHKTHRAKCAEVELRRLRRIRDELWGLLDQHGEGVEIS
jgi:hypothetical protein|tara:strand:- start:786 stop:1010 length:225 start_codon:yes stop_codon:yes gene_type:complete